MKFDEVLEEIGGFGRYQKWVFFLTLPPNLLAGFFMLNPVFLLAVPLHRCAIPGYDNDTYQVHNEYHQYLIDMTIPRSDLDDETYDRCNIYVPIKTKPENESFMQIFEAPNNTERKSCNRWVYDKSVFEETFASQENLVCEDEIMVANAEMIFYGGMLVGSLVSGIFADKYGRKIVMYVSLLTMVISATSLSFAHTYSLFVILEFILGAALVSAFVTGYIISLEFTSASKRVWPGVISDFPYVVGLVLYAVIAYLLRDWFWIELCTAIPGVVFIAYWWLMPESPRWLLSKGRVKEAEVIIRRAAKWNKATLPKHLFDEKSLKEAAYKNEANVLHLFSTKTLCFRTCLIFFNWTVVAFTYFGLSLNTDNLAGDMYLNFGLLGFVEVPAYFIVLVLLDRIGRRRLYCSMMLIGGTACVSTFLVIEYGSVGVDAITLALTLIGKLCVTAGYSVQYIHSAELFPTVVRNAGVGGASLFARLGTMVAPYIVNLGENLDGSIGKSLPLVIFGSMAFISGFLSLLLPETLNKNLPETVEDGDRFGKSGAFFFVQSLRLHNSYRDTSIKVASIKVASIKEQDSECELLISTEYKRKR